MANIGRDRILCSTFIKRTIACKLAGAAGQEIGVESEMRRHLIDITLRIGRQIRHIVGAGGESCNQKAKKNAKTEKHREPPAIGNREDCCHTIVIGLARHQTTRGRGNLTENSSFPDVSPLA
jgi:hypothetical protein